MFKGKSPKRHWKASDLTLEEGAGHERLVKANLTSTQHQEWMLGIFLFFFLAATLYTCMCVEARGQYQVSFSVTPQFQLDWRDKSQESPCLHLPSAGTGLLLFWTLVPEPKAMPG